ncbi:transglutaminase/protease-like cytokinesis protein 3 [Clostridium acetobutylicum]|uniref:Transglutaminase-like predicted protease domain fused ChW-repeats and cell-adhesion domain n=1 Tax=Clostridium acetobutylicum (strain ATCC 824 / DSM 792 / JCM 1419 / IAM 19013 / LMG 5710 / NBRC 13948 / NRRL B-527 / VKM B-1787 / 2291 / W) TaxID=272562 RepID=Q97TU4_CLOAB|nr:MULTISPECIES: Ig-like domain-containing protein [Clostridium]AAK76749.1 Transglutaminase-like predicted protease domain fused ChW-repeats and cell-adhesion domain [Clostridium acetobutylicum ATCC 824]ADZ22785.1 Transglutaminase-like predicted protease domain fused ChW-repeats and cell-adhesion domain [Clostridium acetobutylicum EA 2018]AEI34745.1 ChW repeat-/cell adhesion domain-containing transglutaminase-like protease [Clostridium acetobutylicum DSM 1731]AWV82292.1 DUF5050 domain-containin
MKKKNVVLSIVLALVFILFYSGSTLKADSNNAAISYEAHVQNIGWQNWVNDGAEAGTDGQALRVEALKVKLINAPVGAQITYRTHVQNIGWQNWVNDGTETGTDGLGLRVEALEIKLVNMPEYSVQYQVHVQNVGWQNWVSDGAEAGTDGKGLRVEALRIKIVKKTAVQAISLDKTSDMLKVGQTDILNANVSPVNVDNKNLSWTSSDSSIVSVDSSGKIAALKKGTAIITVVSPDGAKASSCKITVNSGDLGVTYETHVQNIGWQDWVYDGNESGTEGKGLRIEALKMNLVNAPSGAQITYRTYVQNIGWQDWSSNGAEAGTEGKGFRIEALDIKLINMPEYTIQYQAYVQNVGWQNWVSDGIEAGEAGKGLRIEALRVRLVKKVHVQAITLQKADASLNIGDVYSLVATISPIDATNKNIKWTSSNEYVASVDDNGNIKALSIGTAVITAATEDGNKTVSCKIIVNSSNKEDTQALEKAKDILAHIIKPDMTQVQKELVIHDYIVANTKYDKDIFHTYDVPYSVYTAYGVLINHEAVCAGYAEAFKLMCNIEDIPANTVVDYNINHEWNIVRLDDGNYYEVDTTWDDPIYFDENKSDVSHRYFNLSDKQMLADHSINKGEWDSKGYPKAAIDNKEFYSITDDSYDSNMVYTSYAGKLSGVDSEGNVKVIANDDARNIIYYNGLIYYISNDSIYRIDTNGQSKVQIARNASKMYIYNGDIYYLGDNDWAIHRVKIDWKYNNNDNSILAYTWSANYFINDGYLYYEANDHLGLHKINLSTLSDQEILKVSDYNVTNYKDYIYYKDSNKLYRADLNGDNIKLISSNITQWMQIYMNYIYYSNDDITWYKMDLDGSNLTNLLI